MGAKGRVRTACQGPCPPAVSWHQAALDPLFLLLNLLTLESIFSTATVMYEIKGRQDHCSEQETLCSRAESPRWILEDWITCVSQGLAMQNQWSYAENKQCLLLYMNYWNNFFWSALQFFYSIKHISRYTFNLGSMSTYSVFYSVNFLSGSCKSLVSETAQLP